MKHLGSTCAAGRLPREESGKDQTVPMDRLRMALLGHRQADA